MELASGLRIMVVMRRDHFPAVAGFMMKDAMRRRRFESGGLVRQDRSKQHMTLRDMRTPGRPCKQYSASAQ